MIKERIKSSIIILLIINIIFLTSELWFVYGSRHIGEEIIKHVKSLPVISSFFPTYPPYQLSAFSRFLTLRYTKNRTISAINAATAKMTQSRFWVKSPVCGVTGSVVGAGDVGETVVGATVVGEGAGSVAGGSVGASVAFGRNFA